MISGKTPVHTVQLHLGLCLFAFHGGDGQAMSKRNKYDVLAEYWKFADVSPY